MVATFAIDTHQMRHRQPLLKINKTQHITLIEASAHYGSHIAIAL